MSPSYPEIAKAIRSARLRKGMTQEQAAHHVGVSRFHWIRWEQGLHKPSVEHQVELISLGVDAAVFEDEDEGPDVLFEKLALYYRNGKQPA